jgi:phage-related protein (TIGR01555 family)
MLPVMTPDAPARKATPAEAMRENANRMALTLSVDAPIVARPHKLPALPPGVRPAGGIASDNALGSMFGFLNTPGSGFCGLGFPGYPYLAELAQRSEYRAPIEAIANELTREWIKLTGGDETKRDRLDELMIEFGVREKFRLAAIHDGTFGRGQIYVNIKGQDGPNRRRQPLKVDPATIKVGSLVGFQNIEPMWTTPYAYNTSDPTLPDFYRPDRWYIMGKETSADRLLTFISRPVPDMLKPSYNFGGLSLPQLIEPYVIRWLKVVDGVSRIITSFSVTYLATDMQATLTDAGAADTLAQRARIFNMTRDNRGVAFYNKDTEELGQINTPLSGLSELQAQAQEHMAAPTHVPLVFLTGITPGGLNASSEGEIKVFYNWIAGEQENLFDCHLRTVLQILQLHEWGQIDEEITFEWVPLDSPTDKESSEIRKSDSDAAVGLVAGGIISPDEAREALRSDPNSGYTQLKGDAPAQPDPLAEGEQAHTLGEEGKELDHGRAEEQAQNDHERNLELEKAKAKNKPKPASDAMPSALRAWWLKFTGRA